MGDLEEPLPQPSFDWDAARLRAKAMEAIRTLAELPPPDAVLAAWMKANSYGAPERSSTLRALVAVQAPPRAV